LLADLMDMGSLGAVGDDDMKAVDIGSVLDRVCDMLRLDADNKRISLKVVVSARRSLRARENHIERLVENLAGNAIKYTPEGGRVEVGLAAGRAGLVLSVADSGVGISADSLPHVFEEFYRADNVRKSHEGTGLGLALVKRIVDRYGASIRVSSNPGAGTTFVVTWPDAALEPEHGAEPVE
ncbi:MAG TPA: HAMP domain-containing sensor histidine kinase, partial [Myxococcota bacterium]|nr:HAMP domain-containing sensor histidine kinase [Myxococcota bacterium]